MVLVASVSEVEGGGRNMADLCLARVLKHATPQPAFVDTSWRAGTLYRGVARIFGGGGGGVPRVGPRSAKEANNPNKRAAQLKPRPCAHQGSMFRP